MCAFSVLSILSELFSEATNWKNELSVTSEEELFEMPTIVQKEFKKHSCYSNDQHDKIEINGKPGE